MSETNQCVSCKHGHFNIMSQNRGCHQITVALWAHMSTSSDHYACCDVSQRTPFCQKRIKASLVSMIISILCRNIESQNVFK